MDKMLKGGNPPKEMTEQPPGASSRGRDDSKSLGNTPGLPGERGGKMYHEILNDKMSKKLTGC